VTRPSRTGVRGLVVTADGRRAIDLRYRAPDGRRLRYKEALPPGTSARTAESRAREVLTAAYAGNLVPKRQAPAATFQAAWDAYLTWVAINRPKAHSQRTNIAATWVRVVGNVSVLAIDGALCARYIAARSGKSAPATVNKGLRTLRHLAGLSAKGAIAAGITRAQALALRDVPLLREPPGRQRPIAPHELDALMAEFTRRGDGRFARRVVLASLLTGMRLGEVLALTPERVRGNVIDLPRTKQNRVHQVPVSAAMAALVAEARADRPDWWERAPAVVFPSRLGLPYTVDGFSKHFARVAERAGVEDITFHDLRRHVGTTLINAGERLEVVSRLLGHSTVAVTQRSYAHLTTEATRAAVDALAGNAPAMPPRGKQRVRVSVK
jgi:integrase